MEEWRDVVGFPKYEVSNTGYVRNKRKKTILKGDMSSRYLRVHLTGQERRNVHLLVMETFGTAKPFSDAQVNHIDGDRNNNSIDNLEWVTGSQNVVHAYDTGLTPAGEDHPNSKMSNSQVHEVCRLIQTGLIRSDILNRCPSCSLESFNAIRGRRNWKRISQSYKW